MEFGKHRFMNDVRDYSPTSRFSDRVRDYELYRPGYPSAVTDWLIQVAGLQAGDWVADVGAGTGLFTRDLLQSGLRVYGVEPNGPMREAAATQFSSDDRFKAVDGSAEQTTLPNRSVRLVSAAQAFHWFDPPRARAEFARILAPGCGVALVWNVRRVQQAFAHAYEQLLQQHCVDYAGGVPTQADPAVVAAFFAPAKAIVRQFVSVQQFDYDGLRGRLLSSSYTPKEGDPARAPLLAALRDVFNAHSVDGHVSFEYDTKMFFGIL